MTRNYMEGGASAQLDQDWRARSRRSKGGQQFTDHYDAPIREISGTGI